MDDGAGQRITTLVAGAALAAVLAFHPRPAPAADAAAAPAAALSPYIDAHVHLDAAAADRSIEAALAAMPAQNTAMYVFLPSPFPRQSARSFDIELIQAAAGRHADKIAIVGGGGTLNPMIQEAAAAGAVAPELEQRFRARAQQIAQLGAAGFGELAASHRPSASTPSYQTVPPDHPLLLVLADIAAEHDLPITLHLEAVPQAMPLPASWVVKGLAAPDMLPANMDGFERLLARNPRARIVWEHGGWDNTGFRTPELCRRLLAAHPNLFMEIKIDPQGPGLNSPLAGGASGSLKPQWLALLQEFPTRFVLGSDQHFPMPHDAEQRWEGVVRFLNELPPDLRRRIAGENATRIYKLR